MTYKEFKKYISYLEKKDRIWAYFLLFLQESRLYLVRKYILIALLMPIYLIKIITSYICDAIDPEEPWFFGKKNSDLVRKLKKIIDKNNKLL